MPATTAFASSDFGWIPGNLAPDPVWTMGPFSGELRVDAAYHYSLARPRDDTLVGSTAALRHGELQLTEVAFGGNVDWRGVQARLMLQLGLYSQSTPRNDASVARGQWQLADAYRYLSEAYAGYHIEALSGINLQAGLFMSYLGLWSYHNADNWTYQASYVSSNTPWFFTGARMQIFITPRLKVEPYLVNGWQSYGRFNTAPGIGAQLAWRPRANVAAVTNNYAGTDTLGAAGRWRLHTDNSLMLKLYESHGFVRRSAVSLTLDAGCEQGDGVRCRDQYFLGAMAYHRLWLYNERLGLTVGGGAIKNPGRYLVLLPPINGATAVSGTPAFTAAPKDPFWAWDVQVTCDVRPQPQLMLRLEYTHRWASVPYFAGRGGVTPAGGNVAPAGAAVLGFVPDLVRQENRLTLALLVKL